MDYDIFISHASEDKEAVARPLARHLERFGLRVWLDECELTLGDSLRRKIDQGLSCSRYGVVILSQAFFSKEWPNKELDGLVAREDGSDKVILPIWHNVSATDILKFSPMLADKVAVSTSRGIPHVVNRVREAIRCTTTTKTESNTPVIDVELNPLERIRRKMLLSSTSRELRQSMYELEAQLALDPHSPEGRELKDQLQVALYRAEAHERRSKRFQGYDGPIRQESTRPSRFNVPIIFYVAVAIIFYVALASAVLIAALQFLGVI